MKKLMIASLAAFAVGGAFAAPLVYDYKASVKHMYEKVQKAGNFNYYVKYVKSSKLQGYFVQDKDHASLLSQTEMTGTGFLSQKRGFLVLINKSAEKNYRTPKIMPAQLDVKVAVTKVDKNGNAAKSIAEAYFYAGPFAALANSATATWDGSQDDGKDFVATSLAAGVRTYGTEGSTLYLFGQHNTYNRYDNSLMPASPLGQPASGINAFGDAWMNGAGFGTIGTATAGLCCGWETSAGGSSVKSISGNLKGGLFLCSIGGELANGWYFALGLEDLYKADDTNVGGRAVQGNDPAADLPYDENVWYDGELALSTTDVVSGSWTLKPAGKKFQAASLTAAEQAWAGFATILATPAGTTLLQNIKAANQLLDKNYSLTTDTEPSALAGQNTQGLISPAFATLYL